jgi:hypothetical protein
MGLFDGGWKDYNLWDDIKQWWDKGGFAYSINESVKRDQENWKNMWNPTPEVVEFAGATEARQRAGSYAEPSQNAFKTMIDAGSQQAAQMQAAQMQAAQMRAAGIDPEAFMQSWKGAQGDLFNTAFSATSPYAQAMTQVAQRQAALGSEAALAAMPGARNSGAGMAAFGQAYADPFAQAQVAQQQLATGLYGDLSGRAMDQYGRNFIQNADWTQQANMQNAGWQNQANAQNAGWTQQARMQNQAMEEAWRQRQLQAGNMLSTNALGWGNIEAGLASDLNYIYEPMGLYDYLKDIIAMGAQGASAINWAPAPTSNPNAIPTTTTVS